MQTALFQRRSRSGWLEELDGIREEALDAPDGGVGQVADADDIWTDLREGGVYADPHEISSLYADDETPDLPVTKPAAKPQAKATSKAVSKPAAKASSKAGRGSRSILQRRAPEGEGTDGAPVDAQAPAPVAEATVQEVAHDDDIWTSAPPGADPMDALAGQHALDDQLLVQPAPHPVHPQEMWHPAELVITPFTVAPTLIEHEPVAPTAARAAEPSEPQAAAQVIEQPVVAPPVVEPPAFDPFAGPVVEPHADLEAELRAVADGTGAAGAMADVEPGGPGLIGGPIARRHRRDRPQPEQRRAVLPGAEERSPLPEAPLEPAALPISPFSRKATPPAPDLVAQPAPVAEVERVPDTPPFPDAPPFDVAIEEPAPSAAALLVEASVDGLIPAPGTIVRVGGARKAAAESHATELRVALDEGWCWVSPGDGIPVAVRIELDAVEVTAEPGATVLVVVEEDRSAFVAVADGRAELRRGEQAGPLERGAIVMVDPAGVAQIDQATDDELVADPIVAENLALDAEL